jgi:hypothetical protein
MKNTLHLIGALFTLTQAFAQALDSSLLIEQLDQRTYFSKTYYNERDNTFKTVMSTGPIHYLADDGKLKDIDTNLKLDKSGAYYIIDSGLYNAAFMSLEKAIGMWRMKFPSRCIRNLSIPAGSRRSHGYVGRS